MVWKTRSCVYYFGRCWVFLLPPNISLSLSLFQQPTWPPTPLPQLDPPIHQLLHQCYDILPWASFLSNPISSSSSSSYRQPRNRLILFLQLRSSSRTWERITYEDPVSCCTASISATARCNYERVHRGEEINSKCRNGFSNGARPATTIMRI